MENPIMNQQDAIKLVQPFYDFLGGDSTPEQVKPSYHEDWKSYYSNTGSRNMEETIGFVSGPLAQMVPDLKWKIKEVYITPQNQIIIRGEATGTPIGNNFMGSPISGGKSFKFMSIDIHELRDGKISHTYHVEDWMNAIQQVANN
ncbi:MAG: ester cyclase [Saprospiraceae bacterium]